MTIQLLFAIISALCICLILGLIYYERTLQEMREHEAKLTHDNFRAFTLLQEIEQRIEYYKNKSLGKTEFYKQIKYLIDKF